MRHTSGDVVYFALLAFGLGIGGGLLVASFMLWRILP